MAEDTPMVTAIDVPKGFDPSKVDYSQDINSGKVAQPGGSWAGREPVVLDEEQDEAFDVAVADDTTEEQETAEAATPSDEVE
jgi:hypothetical protein